MAVIYNYPGAANAEVYEWENRIADPDGRLEAFMQSVVPFEGRTLIDIGSGSAYHAHRYARTAAHVYAVEPSPDMLAQAFKRLAGEPLPNLSLIAAHAEDIPLRDGLADVIHSRFAYFFGPATKRVRSCEPGIREAQRLLKPGGVFFVIDNHLLAGDFARFLAYMYDDVEKEEARLRAFWHDQGFEVQTIASSWKAPDRQILCRVIEMEFRPDQVEPVMEQIPGTELTYHFNVYYYRK